VYLDTSPARTAGQAYRLALRAGYSALRTAVTPGEIDRFEAATGQVEAYLTERFQPGVPGIAVFASGDAGYFYAVTLPSPPEDMVAWEDRPQITTLTTALDELERVGLALIDKQRARLFTVHLGAIEAQRDFVDDVPGKQATGDWYALAQSRYARHHEDHVIRHLKRTVQELTALLRSHPFDRLFLAGPPEVVAMLQPQLPRPLQSRLAGTLRLEMYAAESQILEAVLRAAEDAERRDDEAAVEALLEAWGGRRAVVGLEATLTALNEKRTRSLILAEGFEHLGGHCPDCAGLTLNRDRCPACQAMVRPLADLREPIIDAALAQGATVNIVAGPAAAQLAKEGGIGAWTRTD
jgi:peptide subunit release factor 1 (eRF1)